MLDNPTVALAVLAALVFVGVGLEELFRKTGIPDVLLLLGIGLAASLAGLVDLSKIDGVDQVFTTAALVLILFEGAVKLRLEDLRTSLSGATLLTIASFTLTVLGVLMMGWIFFGLSFGAALLLGTIVGGTSSAVVIPMISKMPVRQDTRIVLTLESALSDVLCIVFTLAIVGALAAGKFDAGQMGKDLFVGFFGALLLGGLAGWTWSVWMRDLRKKRSSILFVAAAVFLVYALAEGLAMFGAIACLAFGIVLGNATDLVKGKPWAKDVGLGESERTFLTEVAFLLKVFFFVYLGASLNLAGYEPLLYGGLATLAIAVVRPIAVRLSMRSKETTRGDAIIASALMPKGLAAAVLAALPVQAGLAGAETIQSVSFGVILLSILVASVLSLFAERHFVRAAYDPLFKSYPESIAEEVPAPVVETPAQTEPPAAADDEVTEAASEPPKVEDEDKV